jgi:site-specific DNA recombinase
LERLRDSAKRGEVDAVVVLSPDRLARNYAHQWFLMEEFEKLQGQWLFLQNPFGDTPPGKLLTPLQGMMAEYEGAQSHERPRRGRLEKARRGEFMPWAYSCDGYRYLPTRQGCTPQVAIDPEEAAGVRQLYQAVGEEQVSWRQLTKRLNETQPPTPSGKNPVWQPATVRNILTHRVYTGQARYNYRQPVLPKYRKADETQIHYLKTGRSYRPAQEWVWSEAPAILTVELCEKVQLQLHRNAEGARKMYQPTSRRYLLRTLVKCGECGLPAAQAVDHTGATALVKVVAAQFTVRFLAFAHMRGEHQEGMGHGHQGPLLPAPSRALMRVRRQGGILLAPYRLRGLP